MPTSSHELENLFNPSSIAIIGASPREGSIGFDLVQNLHLSGYEGKIIPVNPKYDDIMGISIFGDCYNSGNVLVSKVIIKRALPNIPVF